MSHFYGSIKGSRGRATRGGTKSSGYDATAHGWNIGGYIGLHHDDIKDEDIMMLKVNNGTNGTNINIPDIEVFVHESGRFTIFVNGKIIAEQKAEEKTAEAVN